MSAPVFEDKDKKSFIGIVDLLDLCSYALSVVDTIANAADKDAAGSNWKMIFENGLRQKNAKELVSTLLFASWIAFHRDSTTVNLLNISTFL